MVNFSYLLNESVGNPYQAYDLFETEHSHRVYPQALIHSSYRVTDGVSHVIIATIRAAR